LMEGRTEVSANTEVEMILEVDIDLCADDNLRPYQDE